MSGLHADSERPPQTMDRETPEEEERRHREGAARDALDSAAHRYPHGRGEDADANLRSRSSIRAWGAIFGDGRGGSSPGLLLLLVAVAVAVLLFALS